MKILKEELAQYEKDMKLYIMAKIKNRFNDIKFHRCEKCYLESCIRIHDGGALFINCVLFVICEVSDGYLKLELHSNVNSAGMKCYSFDYYFNKECDGFCGYRIENLQIQKIIAYEKEMVETFTNLCHKMYYTDELKLLQKQYYTFLLSSRKTFPRDIRNIISKKILFFKKLKRKKEKNGK